VLRWRGGKQGRREGSKTEETTNFAWTYLAVARAVTGKRGVLTETMGGGGVGKSVRRQADGKGGQCPCYTARVEDRLVGKEDVKTLKKEKTGEGHS